MEVKRIPIEEIVTDEDLLPRTELDEATVERYGRVPVADFPRIVLFQIGTEYKLASGLHRLNRHKQEGLVEVEAEIRYGANGDIIVAACEDNQKHGLPLSRAECRRAIELLLKDLEHGHDSDVALAEIVGCSDKTVAKVRAELGDSLGTSEGGKVGKRRGRDGKEYRLPRGKDAAVPEPDEDEDDVDEFALPIGEFQEPFDEMLKALRAVESTARRLGADPRLRGAFAPRPIQGLVGAARVIIGGLRPVEHCPECKGSGCGSCENLGYVLPLLSGDKPGKWRGPDGEIGEGYRPASTAQAAVLRKVGIEVRGMGMRRATTMLDALTVSGDFTPRVAKNRDNGKGSKSNGQEAKREADSQAQEGGQEAEAVDF